MQLEASVKVVIYLCTCAVRVNHAEYHEPLLVREELGGLVRQISHNSGQEYLWNINPSYLNLNCFSSMVLKVWKQLSGSVSF